VTINTIKADGLDVVQAPGSIAWSGDSKRLAHFSGSFVLSGSYRVLTARLLRC